MYNEENYHYEDFNFDDGSYGYDEDTSLFNLCILPVFVQVSVVFTKILSLTAVVRLASCWLTERSVFYVDVIAGVLCAALFYSSMTLYLGILVLLAYLMMMLSWNSGKCGLTVLISTVVFFIICEWVLVEPELWHMVRGSVIVLLMKVSSVGFDIDGGVITPPCLSLFLGYSLSPSSLIFGPFVTMTQYKQSKTSKLTWSSAVDISNSIVLAYITVLLSTCILSDTTHLSTNTLVSSYMTALSFRTSHYFVCYLSQASSLIAGYQHDGKFKVVSPEMVEVPRSMAKVAVAWNLPMHYWLKTYVYKKSRGLGPFISAFLTYAASSLLHGLNFQLPAVLLSIFTFSYVESGFRDELSKLLDSCVRVTGCRDCCHGNRVFVVPVKLAFIVLNILQLIYLGVMFDASPQQVEGYSWMNTVAKWHDLYWYGHVLAALGLVLTHILKLYNTHHPKEE